LNLFFIGFLLIKIEVILTKNTQLELKEIFKRLEQEIRLHQYLSRKSQRDIRRKSKLERSVFDGNVLFKNTVALMELSTLEDKLQELKDEFLIKEVSREK